MVGAFEESEVETGLDEAEVVGGLELLLDVLLEWLVESDWVVDSGWLVDGGWLVESELEGWLVDEDDAWVDGVLVDIVEELNVGEEVEVDEVEPEVLPGSVNKRSEFWMLQGLT